MKNFNSFVFLLILIRFQLFLLATEFPLDGDYPFSKKFGYSRGITVMNPKNQPEDIALYNLIEDRINIEYIKLSDSCIATEERGAIYSRGYYYLSCLKNINSNQFQIKVYDYDFQKVKTYPSPTTYYTLKNEASISLFIKYSFQEYVGVVWLSAEKLLELLEIDETDIISKSNYPIEYDIARDTDCVFISGPQRIVCGFGLLLNNQADVYKCAINIFKVEDKKIKTTSNFQSEECKNQHSRKLRANNDLNENNTFFYYYVGTDNNAYISKVWMKSDQLVQFRDPQLVIKGCSQSRDSFDLAEDKFIGYNVFSCVEYIYKTQIKVQLFKFVNDEIIFYGNGVNEPDIFKIDGEVSMINFIVLSSDLDFGYLSYRKTINKEAYYTIFNKPKCKKKEVISKIPLNGALEIDFSDITDDNYGECKIQIFNINETAIEIKNNSNKNF